MSCKKYKELMMDIIYGEADPSDEQKFRKHLESCSECRNEFEALGGTRRILDSLPADDPGTKIFFTHPVNAYGESTRKEKKYGRQILTAAAVILAVLSLLNLRIERIDGNFAFSMSLIPGTKAPAGCLTASDLKEYDRQKNEQFAAMLLESREEQTLSTARMMNLVVEEINRKDREQMHTIMAGLQQIDINNRARIEQSGETFMRYLKTAGMKLEQ